MKKIDFKKMSDIVGSGGARCFFLPVTGGIGMSFGLVTGGLVGMVTSGLGSIGTAINCWND